MTYHDFSCQVMTIGVHGMLSLCAGDGGLLLMQVVLSGDCTFLASMGWVAVAVGGNGSGWGVGFQWLPFS